LRPSCVAVFFEVGADDGSDPFEEGIPVILRIVFRVDRVADDDPDHAGFYPVGIFRQQIVAADDRYWHDRELCFQCEHHPAFLELFKLSVEAPRTLGEKKGADAAGKFMHGTVYGLPCALCIIPVYDDHPGKPDGGAEHRDPGKRFLRHEPQRMFQRICNYRRVEIARMVGHEDV